MSKLSNRIAYQVIIGGLFIIAAFIALNYQHLSGDVLMVLALLVVYVVLFGMAAGQNFAMPFQKLMHRVTTLEKGDLKTKVELKEDNELGELAQAINRITENFEKTKTESESQQKHVDIKAKTDVFILQETLAALEQKIRNRNTAYEMMVRETEKMQQVLRAKDEEIAMLKAKKTKK